MKCLDRNKTQFYYALFEKTVPMMDEYGNITGEREIIYTNPLPYSANISPAKGETQSKQFGDDENYDKVIVADSTIPPIDEYSVLWIDLEPKLNVDGSLSTDENGEVLTPHDYIVTKVAKSLNNVSIAVSKVNVQ